MFCPYISKIFAIFLDSTESPVANGDEAAAPSRGRGRPPKPGGPAPKKAAKPNRGRGRPPKKTDFPNLSKKVKNDEEDEESDEVEPPPAKSPKISAGKGRPAPKIQGMKTNYFE